MELTGPGAPAVPAATVVLLRDRQHGPEVLMLRRNSAIAFGGMWVFPGGRVDVADQAVGEQEGELTTARRAAVREVAEETGLVLRAAELTTLSHWSPPPEAPRRFSTWFFVARAPDVAVVVDGGEIHEHTWLRPADALDRQAGGIIELAPPTWVTLWQLRQMPDVDTAITATMAAQPERFATRIVSDGGNVLALWHGDAGYADGDTQRAGGRHRLAMTGSPWHYERTAPI